MLFEDKQIPELYHIRHRNDSDNDYVDYEKKILNSSLSPFLFNNTLMGTFLTKMQKLVSLLFDQHNIIKNWKNYIVDMYYFKNKN